VEIGVEHWAGALGVPAKQPRRPAAWDNRLTEAVEQALAQPEPAPSEGIWAGDWERVLQARRNETDIERLRPLGPQLQAGEIVAVTSDVGCVVPKNAAG
jgi:hypothetical protein